MTVIDQTTARTEEATPAIAAPVKPKHRALGRGLESLLPATPARHAPVPPLATNPDQPEVQAVPAGTSQGPTRWVPVAQIDRNPFQTRQQIDPERLEDLKRSIAEKGLIQPITVRPIADGRFQVIAGERRLLAVKQLGHENVQAHVMQQSDREALETTIVENLQREDLNPMEQARAFGRLASEFQYHHDTIASRTGKSRSAVTNYTRLLFLPDELQRALEEDRLSMGHAKAILGLKDSPEGMSAVGFRVITQELSVRKTEEAVQHVLHGRPKRPEPVTPPMDPNVAHAQERLQGALGLKVNIEDHKGKGRVIIEYGSLDDFESLLLSFGQGKS